MDVITHSARDGPGHYVTYRNRVLQSVLSRGGPWCNQGPLVQSTTPYTALQEHRFQLEALYFADQLLSRCSCASRVAVAPSDKSIISLGGVHHCSASLLLESLRPLSAWRLPLYTRLNLTWQASHWLDGEAGLDLPACNPQSCAAGADWCEGEHCGSELRRSKGTVPPRSSEAAANQMSRPQPGSNQASHAQPGMHSSMGTTPQWPATTSQPTGTGRQILEEQHPSPPELVNGATPSLAAMRQLDGGMASEDVVQRAAEGADAAAPLQHQLSKLSQHKRHLSHGRSASHMRMASDDFEHSAGPMTSNGLGDASCSLPGAEGRLEHHMR